MGSTTIVKSICCGSSASDLYMDKVKFLARFHSLGLQISLSRALINISHKYQALELRLGISTFWVQYW
jgi:hypothetical protein